MRRIALFLVVALTPLFLLTAQLLAQEEHTQINQASNPWQGGIYPPESPVKEWYTAKPQEGIICQALILRRPFDPQLHLRGFDMNWNGKEVVQLVWITRKEGKDKDEVVTKIRIRDRINLVELPKDGYNVFDYYCKRLVNDLPLHVQQLFYGYYQR